MLPRINIFIPYFNEEDFIGEKISNLKELEYDREKLKVYFLDGLSTDQTRKKIREAAQNIPNWHLIETNCNGKINQFWSNYCERVYKITIYNEFHKDCKGFGKVQE